MAGLKKKRRIQFVVAAFSLLALAFAIPMIFFKDSIQDAFQLFRSPSEIAIKPPRANEQFRLGGLVKEGTWQQGTTHRFVVTDFEAEFPVAYTGIVPDLFREGQGTIVTGRISDGVFVATEVLAKHDEEYMPRELVDVLKDKGVYQSDLTN